MNIEIAALEPTLGATVRGVDLDSLSTLEWKKIYKAFLEYAVLIFPEQSLSKEQQEKFSLRFGTIENLMNGAHSIPITNKTPKGDFHAEDSEWMQLLKGNEGWHSDSSYMPLTAKASILSAHVIPTHGGETQWADMRSAYDALDPSTKEKIKGLNAFHSYFHSQAKIGHYVKKGATYGFFDGDAPLHPIVKIHPETGRQALFIGRHACNIPGLSEKNSGYLLDNLLRFSCQDPRVLTHVWSKGDLVVWDNRCVLHRARPYQSGEERLMLHTRIKGEVASESALST